METFTREGLPDLYPKGMDRPKEGRKGAARTWAERWEKYDSWEMNGLRAEGDEARSGSSEGSFMAGIKTGLLPGGF